MGYQKLSGVTVAEDIFSCIEVKFASDDMVYYDLERIRKMSCKAWCWQCLHVDHSPC